MKLFRNPISIKTITGKTITGKTITGKNPSGIKPIWTVDTQKSKELIDFEPFARRVELWQMD
ncbi:MAG: ThaI family type II restriction endonuclease [Treponema sp.]|nr:ThaI family type II restriction endonuclease [Treponema sp.]